MAKLVGLFERASSCEIQSAYLASRIIRGRPTQLIVEPLAACIGKPSGRPRPVAVAWHGISIGYFRPGGCMWLEKIAKPDEECAERKKHCG
jgi:hypothetical protein